MSGQDNFLLKTLFLCQYDLQPHGFCDEDVLHGLKLNLNGLFNCPITPDEVLDFGISIDIWKIISTFWLNSCFLQELIIQSPDTPARGEEKWFSESQSVCMYGVKKKSTI